MNGKSSKKFSRTGTQGRKSQNLSSKEEKIGIYGKCRDRTEDNIREFDIILDGSKKSKLSPCHDDDLDTKKVT